MTNKGLPRSVEVVLAAFGLIALSPALALTALAVALSSRGPVLFKQSRIGLDGKEFTLFKFRSMRLTNTGPQITSGDDKRITLIGKLLRKTKIDEFPELYNVLIGNMSFVGPRPEVPRYFDPQNPLWQKVVQVRPGITDPVTLTLRNEEELLRSVDGDREKFYIEKLQPYKLKGYVDYLETRTAWSDVVVILKTLGAILGRG